MSQKYSQTNPYAYYGNQVPGYSNQPVYGGAGAAFNPSAQSGGLIFQPGLPNTGIPNPAQFVPGMLPLEESYIENILRLNKGKLAKVYMTFGDNVQKNFVGIVEAAGRDHIILSDPQTGMRYLLLMVYLDYVTFDEELNYEYPGFTGATAAPGMTPLTAYPPR
ncbi:spore germination protein Q [Bacillus mesophilus]|uniref:Spore coat protein GerQ n=1 Tax=Bacillus mesophilus TaxID=1808955 RepID=A0A6M0QB46_9BACI|nr:spore coat protein GerQ [Bacillus mesophilus]MBM7662404.1 spore germination protein Q [Bacillus mesophilus]NEY72969.1 spore coat protein GerQ [Bacillus mesophilus]